MVVLGSYRLFRIGEGIRIRHLIMDLWSWSFGLPTFLRARNLVKTEFWFLLSGPIVIRGQASSSEELKLSDYDPLFLHSNDSNGNPIISFKLEDDDVLRQEQWDRCNSVVLSWILGCVTQELYLVDLPKCTYDTAEKLKKHDQLIILLQLLMGLDDVFGNVRSSILITEPLLDVKYAFATLS
ncbi:hypothetical protein Tco_1075141 [Tanacetum coccineum]